MSLLASWLASPPPDAAIEIGADRVAAAMVATRGNGLVVTAHAVEPLAPGLVTPSLTAANVQDRTAVAAVVRRVLERLGSRVRRAALVVPDTAVKVSLLRFEQVPARRDDLDQLVRWQLRKAAPFPVDDACVTYSPALGGETGAREFVVEVARREAIREYETVCEDAGVYAGLVDAATLALMGAVGGGLDAAGDWLLVHVRTGYTSIALGRGAHLIFFRSRPDEEGTGLEDLVHQTAMYYQDRLEGQGFARVMLAGSDRPNAGYDVARRSLEERLGTAVEALDPTRVASMTDRIAASPDLLDALGPLIGILRRSQAGVRA